MLVGIVSDSHDNEDSLEQALSALGDVDVLIHAGDLCAPFIIDRLDKADKPVHVVFGNIDDRHLTTKKAEEADNVELHGNEASVSFDDKAFYVTHFPDVARLAAESGEYDVVVHGHTHEQRQEDVHDTVLVNPGELLGRQERRGYATYDTGSGELNMHRLED